tara:strand:- start:215 stop:418 length:204 start_codon:yes stop_codon:yes gene_type:complete
VKTPRLNLPNSSILTGKVSLISFLNILSENRSSDSGLFLSLSLSKKALSLGIRLKKTELFLRRKDGI